MKTSEIIQRIQSLYSRGVQSDDSRLTPRHIYNKMLTVRSKLLAQMAGKRQFISQWNFQTIPCIELVKAPAHECPCLPPIGCDIYKSKEPLPEPLTNLNGHIIQSVTNVTGEIIYSEIGWTEKKYKSANKYTGTKPDYFIRNNYIYITQKKGAQLITVTGLFEDPWEAETFPSYCDKDCTDCATCDSPFDLDFPLDDDMIDTLVEMSINELLLLFTQFVEDKSNNASDDSDLRQQYGRRGQNRQ